MTNLRCWQCGTEPNEVLVVRRLCGEVDHIPNWPTGDDHKHAARPPTPDELAATGGLALDKVRQITMEAMTE